MCSRSVNRVKLSPIAKSLLERRTIRPKLSPIAKFAASLIKIIDKYYDFSLDLSYINIMISLSY